MNHSINKDGPAQKWGTPSIVFPETFSPRSFLLWQAAHFFLLSAKLGKRATPQLLRPP